MCNLAINVDPSGTFRPKANCFWNLESCFSEGRIDDGGRLNLGSPWNSQLEHAEVLGTRTVSL